MEPTNMYPDGTEAQQDLFLDGEFIEYTEATNTQRFINNLVDVLLLQYGLNWLSNLLLVQLLFSLSSGEIPYSPVFLTSLSFCLIIFNHLLYYTLCEKAFHGRTLGKLITGTKVIRTDGEEPTLKDALLRSLCRLVPFEAFSIYSERGLWHDVWTKTKVIQTRR